MTDPIRKKIAALLKMTMSAGCTEAEALAAAEKAAALMKEHGLSCEEISIGQASVRNRSKGHGARDELWAIIGFCTNTAVIHRHATGQAGSDLTFVGNDPGPQIAAYLVAILNRAIDGAIREFKTGRFYRLRRSDATRRAAVRDFTTGMVARLSRRLVDMFRATIDKQASAIAHRASETIFAEARPIDARAAKTRFDAAASEGWAAGSRINLSQGVHGGSDVPCRIGGAS